MADTSSTITVAKAATFGAVVLYSVLDVLPYVCVVAFSLLVWTPELGSERQQSLLGVGSCEDVVDTVYDVVACFAAVVAWRVVNDVKGYYKTNPSTACWTPPAPADCFPSCFT